MIVINKSQTNDDWLTHRGVYRRGNRDGQLTATMSCPDCGKVATLSDHSIDKEGKVTPSVVCPDSKCNFHDFLTLKDWKG